MPVIGHEAVGKEFERDCRKAVGDHALEGGIVLGLVKYLLLANTSIENVKNNSSWGNAGCSWHALKLSE